jgi:hypothetical protein
LLWFLTLSLGDTLGLVFSHKAGAAVFDSCLLLAAFVLYPGTLISYFAVLAGQTAQSLKILHRTGPLGDGQNPLQAPPGFGYWQHSRVWATGINALEDLFVVSVRCPAPWVFEHCLSIQQNHPSKKMESYSSALLSQLIESYLGRAVRAQFDTASPVFKQTLLRRLFALPHLDFATLTAGNGILALRWHHFAIKIDSLDDTALATEIDMYRRALEAIVDAYC